MAVTTGLVHHQGRLVWLGVDVPGIEPGYPTRPTWGFIVGADQTHARIKLYAWAL